MTLQEMLDNFKLKPSSFKNNYSQLFTIPPLRSIYENSSVVDVLVAPVSVR